MPEIRAHDDPAIFIALRDEAEVLAEARALTAAGRTALPLFGIPVVVKDNIDVEGLPTTAACPAYSYRPGHDATAVARLRAAGALILGKTNLDQFATGLVGVRTPYGIGRNLFDPKVIPGGSSTGSALSVGAGIAPLVARHRHRRVGPRAGRFQQHRRAQAEPRTGLKCRRRAGMPHARLRFRHGVYRRRCGDDAAA